MPEAIERLSASIARSARASRSAEAWLLGACRLELAELGITAGEVIEVGRTRIADRFQDDSKLFDRGHGFERSVAIPERTSQEPETNPQPAREPSIIGIELRQRPEPVSGRLEVSNGVGETALQECADA